MQLGQAPHDREQGQHTDDGATEEAGLKKKKAKNRQVVAHYLRIGSEMTCSAGSASLPEMAASEGPTQWTA